MYMHAPQRMILLMKFLSFPAEQIFCITGLLYASLMSRVHDTSWSFSIRIRASMNLYHGMAHAADTGPLHIVPTRGKEEVVELGWTNPKARAEAQQIVTTRLLYCLHHPVS